MWRERVTQWLPVLVFFLLNAAALVVYQVVFAGRVAVTQETVEAAEQDLERLRQERLELEQLLARINDTKHRIDELYEEQFATESERLTAVMREVRDLAEDAGLAPRQTSYPEEAIEDFGLVRRSFVFTVEGTYFDVRELINSLELTPTFLALEEVAVADSSPSSSGDGGQRVAVSLHLSTLFTDPEAQRTPTVARTGRRAAP
jgi:Tfp pilus assembly protein PilO